MIIKTALNAHAGNLHRHLTRLDDGNERIRLVEIRGCVADGAGESDQLRSALREMKATAAGSRCEKSLYHVSFAVPAQDAERMASDAHWLQCADRLEQEFGLQGHARSIVHHFKDGRWHQHVVWNRIDPQTGLAAHLSHERRRAIKVARELEHDLGLTPVSNERKPQRKEQRPPQQWEAEAGRRKKVDVDRLRDQIRAAWAGSDTGHAFTAAMDERGLLVAKGESRPYVAVDEDGNYYALGARVIPGATAPALRAKLADVDAALPTLDQAKAMQLERGRENRYRRKSGEGQGGDDQARGQASSEFVRDFAAEHVALKQRRDEEQTVLDQFQERQRLALAESHARDRARIAELRQVGLLAKLTGVARRQLAKAKAIEKQMTKEARQQQRSQAQAQAALAKRFEQEAKQLREQEKALKRTAAVPAPQRGAPVPAERPQTTDPSVMRAWERARQEELQRKREAERAAKLEQSKGRGRSRARDNKPD